jgi:Ca2+-binding EF-hand superfamily protein
MKTTILILTTAALLLPIQAQESVAKENGAKHKPHSKHMLVALLKKRDTDKNGEVSKEEFLAGAKDPAKADKAFAKLDRNKDGKISKDDRPEKK